MANYRRKHRILKALKSKWDKEARTKRLREHVSKHDTSLTPKELSEKTCIRINKLNDLCQILLVDGLIEIVNSGNLNLPDKYNITSKGKRYVTDKILLKEIPWKKIDTLLKITTIASTAVAIFAALNSIFRWVEY